MRAPKLEQILPMADAPRGSWLTFVFERDGDAVDVTVTTDGAERNTSGERVPATVEALVEAIRFHEGVDHVETPAILREWLELER